MLVGAAPSVRISRVTHEVECTSAVWQLGVPLAPVQGLAATAEKRAFLQIADLQPLRPPEPLIQACGRLKANCDGQRKAAVGPERHIGIFGTSRASEPDEGLTCYHVFAIERNAWGTVQVVPKSQSFTHPKTE